MLDLKVTFQNDKKADVQIQINNLRDTQKKLQLSGSKLLLNQLTSEENYRKIKEVIIIAILDFELTTLPDYHIETITVTKKNRNYEILNFIKYHIVELPKFRKVYKNFKNKLDQWLTFIDYTNKSEMKIASKNNIEIEKAINELENLKADENVRDLAQKREMKKISEMLFLDIIN